MPNYNEIWSDKGLIFLLKLLVFASNVASKPLKEGYWVWFVDKGTLLIKLITVDHRGSRKWLPPTVLKEYRTGGRFNYNIFSPIYENITKYCLVV